MNERIQELAIEADEWMSNTANWRHITGNPNIIRDCKFAELIIKECAEVAKETRWFVPPSQEQIARGIKQHFGIE